MERRRREEKIDEIKMMTKMVVRRSERRSGDQLDLRNRQKRGRKRKKREKIDTLR